MTPRRQHQPVSAADRCPLCPDSDQIPQRNEMSRRANALNRFAIARCAGGPTASTVAGVKIVDSARVALS
jgi:hypothetical protein